MTDVLLHGGALDGATATVGDPWPRSFIHLDNGAGGTLVYAVRDGVDEADLWVPPPEDTDSIDVGYLIPGPEGPEGPPGPIGDKGDPGDPTQISFTGPWDPATQYAQWDMASTSDGLWLALSASLNTAPAEGAFWTLFAPPGPEGPEGPEGPTGPQGDPGSPLPVREQTVLVTAALLSDAQEQGTVPLAVGFRVLRMITDKAARVVLYTTPAKRDADAGRAAGVDPDPATDHGVVVEVTTSAALLALDLSPVPQGYSMEAVPSADIAYTVTNLGAVGPVTVTFIWQQQEA